MPNEFGKPRWGGGGRICIVGAAARITQASAQYGIDKTFGPGGPKQGRGIYRRFFYWIPSKGVGAVNRSRLPTLMAEGTSKLHEFVDVSRPGKVSTRRASSPTLRR